MSPRDVVAACLPDPATLGDKMSGKTCAGLYVTGKGKDGEPRATYLYHVVDNEWAMKEYGHQCVVWQTAINPVVALELLATGVWHGTGVLGPEAFDAVPFLDLLTAYGSPWGQRDDQQEGAAHDSRRDPTSGVRRRAARGTSPACCGCGPGGVCARRGAGPRPSPPASGPPPPSTSRLGHRPTESRGRVALRLRGTGSCTSPTQSRVVWWTIT